MKAVGPRWPPSERSAWRHLVELLVSRVELLMCFNGPTWRNESGVKPVQLQTIYSEYSCIWSLTTHIQMLIPTNVFIKTSKQMNILRNKREIQINNLDSRWIKWIKKNSRDTTPTFTLSLRDITWRWKVKLLNCIAYNWSLTDTNTQTNTQTNTNKPTVTLLWHHQLGCDWPLQAVLDSIPLWHHRWACPLCVTDRWAASAAVHWGLLPANHSPAGGSQGTFKINEDAIPPAYSRGHQHSATGTR